MSSPPIAVRLPLDVAVALKLPYLAEAGAADLSEYIEWAAQNITAAQVGDENPLQVWAKHYRWMYRGKLGDDAPQISIRPSDAMLKLAADNGLSIRELIFTAACRAAYYSRLEAAEQQSGE